MAKRYTTGPFGEAPKITTVIPDHTMEELKKHQWAVYSDDDTVVQKIRTYLEEQQEDSEIYMIKHGTENLPGFRVPHAVVMYLRSLKLKKNEAVFRPFHRVDNHAKWREWQEGKKPVGTLAARGLLDTADKNNFRAEVRAVRKASKQ